METYLGKPISVALERLYPDPNNPRLGLDDVPGYADAAALFAPAVRDKILGELGHNAYAVDELVGAIVGQGWMPIDNIVVWRHPDDEGKLVVVEGNRRRLALELIHKQQLPKETRRLERMREQKATYSTADLREQEDLVARLQRIVEDTTQLQVVPLAAKDVDELRHKLPRVLAVRHITGAKVWGSYAEDIWLLKRYVQSHEEKYGEGAGLSWDDALIGGVAAEASLGDTKTKRQLKAASWYSHFRAEFEDELPEGEKFQPDDYYLFELISRNPWVRGQFGISDADVHIPAEGERVIFDWVFKLPRPRKADDNRNVFYRHENVRLWAQMRAYDDENNTSFSSRLDVQNHLDAPSMHQLEAEWLSHKARRKPVAVIDDLLRRLNELTAESLASEGQFLRLQLEQLRDTSAKFLKMIDAAER